MTSVIKGGIFRQDFANWDGVDRNATRKDSGGGTVTGLKIGFEVDVLMVYGRGESFTRGTISSCTSRIGSSTNATLVFSPGTWVIDDDLTIGSNFACRVPSGCVFQVASGKTLTFSGPVYRDNNTWTSGSGTVTESGTKYFTGKLDLTSAVLQGGTPLVFEGATDNTFETSIVVTDPTADRTITFPDANLDLSSVPSANGSNTFTGSNTFSGTAVFSGTFTGKILVPTNIRLNASVASSALTVALKGNDGNDPSASNPVYIPFRNVTGDTGDITWLEVTAATSIVISSGSTLGTTSGEISRVWIVAFNDGGTLRLGAMLASTSTRFFPLASDMLASSTAEGGAGGADTAGTIYTSSAVSSKAMRVLGYVESTQATAGTWATSPSKVQVWFDGMKLPGDTVQHSWATKTDTFTTTSTTYTDITGMSVTLTPTSSANRIKVHSNFLLASSLATDAAFVQLVRDSTAIGIGDAASNRIRCSTGIQTDGAAQHFPAGILWMDSPATTSSTTYKLQMRVNSGGTAGCLNRSGSDTDGTSFGRAASMIMATEIMA